MYHEYFGLSEPAFSIAVNPKYLYMSQPHKEALAHLLYGVQDGGFVLLSGEVGTGKTTIIRCLLEQLPERTDIAYILNPMADIPALLATICEELHIHLDNAASVKTMMDELQRRLLDNHAHNQRTVLLIDEAQLLSVEVLEQIRLLTNLETANQKLLQIILVGQPEINDLLAQPRLRQLSQRITARCHLQALNLQDTTHYIQHRLNVAGKKNDQVIFPKHIIKKIHQFSKGTPRLINIFCERLLLGAYAHNRFTINKQIYQLALAEVKDLDQNKNNSQKITWFAFAVSVSIISVALALFIQPSLTTEKSNPEPKTISTDEPKEYESSHYAISQSQAFAMLFAYHNIDTRSDSHPCWQSEHHQLFCEKIQQQNWESFRALNRPALLTLKNTATETRHILVIGENESQLIVLSTDGQWLYKEKTALLNDWTGEITYLWRKPLDYTSPLKQGMRSPLIAETAKRFALLDNQQQALTDNYFSPLFETRVKLFQKQHNLNDDGILGQNTLMKLNEQLGLATTFIDTTQHNQQP